MVKIRGFKPGGTENPLLLRRRNIVNTGPTIKEKLERSSRPTWDELRKLLNNKEVSDNKDVEAQNALYVEKMNEIREKKLGKLWSKDNSSHKNSKDANYQVNNYKLKQEPNRRYSTSKYYKEHRSRSFDRSTPTSEY
ncbi:uncharacterized protein CMU_015360 [Cryptosporidium muris RN66]|uniref:Uncharacterized protein n=1 Tax=Cryptosporidium muris (strain RN66) TaxID=441375 RepID=B6AEB3_CRYMR|nr:uncharacterized protein CMU_015360 [Cryptosporidium muris RN66]EEA06859.1 hypothetical protein, conserved [Cryptosporidium muris RN66]|eukprot:XP_002141208.1 hypothetical protein [Cryptosporidium muris RN66]